MEPVLENRDLMQSLFEYLDLQSLGRAQQVCKRWREVAQRPTIKERMDRAWQQVREEIAALYPTAEVPEPLNMEDRFEWYQILADRCQGPLPEDYNTEPSSPIARKAYEFHQSLFRSAVFGFNGAAFVAGLTSILALAAIATGLTAGVWMGRSNWSQAFSDFWGIGWEVIQHYDAFVDVPFMNFVILAPPSILVFYLEPRRLQVEQENSRVWNHWYGGSDRGRLGLTALSLAGSCAIAYLFHRQKGIVTRYWDLMGSDSWAFFVYNVAITASSFALGVSMTSISAIRTNVPLLRHNRDRRWFLHYDHLSALAIRRLFRAGPRETDLTEADYRLLAGISRLHAITGANGLDFCRAQWRHRHLQLPDGG